MILIFYVSEKFPQAFLDVFRRVTTAVQPRYLLVFVFACWVIFHAFVAVGSFFF